MSPGSGPGPELLGIFVDEAGSRLSALAAGLLRLEDGLDPELVAILFREAHTIKGAAVVVGFDEVGGVAHRMENLLEDLRDGRRPPSAALIDTLLRSVDGLRSMIDDLRTGADVSAAAAALRDALDGFSESAATSPPAPLPAAQAPPPSPPAPPDRAEAIRVPAARLDSLVRLVGESAAAGLRVGRVLTDRIGPAATDLDPVRELSRSLNELQDVTMRTRMVPVSTIVEPLQRTVRDLAHDLGRPVRWEGRGVDTELDRGVLAELADPMLHLVRNAVDHGIEPAADRRAAGKPEVATVRLDATQVGSEVVLAISDDGAGIDVAAVRAAAAVRDPAAAALPDEEVLQLIFRPGLSTAARVTELSGRGVGLDVVKEAVDALRGRIEVRSTPGEGTEFRIRVPITLALLRCLIVAAGGRRYALPMPSIVVIGTAEEGEPMVVDGAAVDVTALPLVLGVEGPFAATRGAAVVMAARDRRHAFVVDELLGQRDVVVKGLPRLVRRNELLTGASIEPDGSVLCVLDGAGLVERAGVLRGEAAAVTPGGDRRGPDRRSQDRRSEERRSEGRRSEGRQSLLVVDDALTVRELQRVVLERAGYEVRTASNGRQALDALDERPADLVLTDIEMPDMNGFELTAAIRAVAAFDETRVLILTSRASEDDRRRGHEAGADGYLLKSSLARGGLLVAVARLTGTHP